MTETVYEIITEIITGEFMTSWNKYCQVQTK